MTKKISQSVSPMESKLSTSLERLCKKLERQVFMSLRPLSEPQLKSLKGILKLTSLPEYPLDYLLKSIPGQFLEAAGPSTCSLKEICCILVLRIQLSAGYMPPSLESKILKRQ